MGEVESIRGRFHPDLHPVLRVLHREPTCRVYGLPFIEDGEEYVRSCGRPAGHTGRHFDWEWVGRTQKVHVWTDAEVVDDTPAPDAVPSGEATDGTTPTKEACSSCWHPRDQRGGCVICQPGTPTPTKEA